MGRDRNLVLRRAFLGALNFGKLSFNKMCKKSCLFDKYIDRFEGLFHTILPFDPQYLFHTGQKPGEENRSLDIQALQKKDRLWLIIEWKTCIWLKKAHCDLNNKILLNTESHHVNLIHNHTKKISPKTQPSNDDEKLCDRTVSMLRALKLMEDFWCWASWLFIRLAIVLRLGRGRITRL